MNWSSFLSNALWVALIAWLAGFRFRPTLEKLLDRVKSARPKGFEFSEISQQVQIRASTPPGELNPLLDFSRTPAIQSVERSLHAELSEYPADGQVDVLVRALAQSNLERNYEQTYTAMFGSQIRMMITLNRIGSFPMEDAKTFYEPAEKEFPDFFNFYPFETWLRFIGDRALVMVEDNRVTITPVGRDFVIYLTARGLSDGGKAF